MNKKRQITAFVLVFFIVLGVFANKILATDSSLNSTEDLPDEADIYNGILHKENYNIDLDIDGTNNIKETLHIDDENDEYEAQGEEENLNGDPGSIDNEVIEDIETRDKQSDFEDGWHEIDGQWYYYDSGTIKTGWLKYGIKWYYLNDKGVMQTGWQKVGEKWYYLNSSGAMKTGWQKINSKWYYLSSSGVMQIGWQKIEGKWYYLTSDGAMVIGWQKVENEWYYMKPNGEMVTGDFSIKDKINSFCDSGKWQGVWEKNPKGRWFKYSNGEYPKDQWANLGGKWYHFDKNGYMETHWQKINNKWYYMDDSGVMQTGWVKISSKWYYMDNSGVMQTGWLGLDDRKYYLDDSGAMQTGWLAVDSKWHYMDGSGAMRTGWLELGDKIYYLDNNGAMQTGWLKIDSAWYFMNDSGIMQTGWIKVSNKWYYMDNSGAMQTGWIKLNNKWYYMNKSGAMQTGWLELDDKKYYLDGSGAMQTGWIEVDNIWYFIGNDGLVQQKSNYNSTFDEVLAKQMKVNPQTDYYGGGWKSAKEEDVAFFLNPDNFSRGDLDAIRVTASVNFRSSPDSSNSDNIIRTLGKGGTYVLLDKQDNWYKIIANNRIGWVYGNYIELTTIENNQMFQFLDLSKNTGINPTDLDNILSNKGILKGQGKTFVDASKQHKINEIYLVSHALLETGHGTSRLANGILVEKVDGKPVEPKVVYNMFGIGANDSDPIRLGSEYAYKQGWFTPGQAIIGGAKFVGERYIYRPNNMQNTLYKMRWNPEVPATHQYATDIAWAYKQVKVIKDLYDLCTGYNLYYDIPQYK